MEEKKTWKICYYANGKIKVIYKNLNDKELIEFMDSLRNDESKDSPIMAENMDPACYYYIDGVCKAFAIEKELEDEINDYMNEKKLVDRFGTKWKEAAAFIFGVKTANEKLNISFKEDNEEDDDYLNNWIYLLNHRAGYTTTIDDLALINARIDYWVDRINSCKIESQLYNEMINF